MEKEIYIKNRKGLNMVIKLNVSPGRNKCVFLEHGLGARKEYPHMKVMEDVFAEYGYNVVNIDATNSLNASESSKEGITFTSHYQDLEDAIEWAKTQEFYKEPFALAGHSLGARSCVLYAATHPNNVELLISAALPWINHGEESGLIRDIIDSVAQKGYYDKVSKTTGKTLRIGQAWVDDFNKIDLTDYIPNITAKTYVLVGLMDAEKHVNSGKTCYELLTSSKKLVLLSNVPHDLANSPETKAIFEKELRSVMENQNELSKKSKTVLELEKKAKSGDGLSAYRLGRAYYSGELNMTVDYQKSFEWYEFGHFQLKDPRCQYGWAMFFYDDGESKSEGVVEKNNAFANKFFADALPKLEELANHGDMYSNFILGAYYNYAIGGVEKDFNKVIKYIQKSADLGHCGACFDMGKFYAEGRGVKKDIQKAKQYYKKAIELGSTRAKTSLQELEEE